MGTVVYQNSDRKISGEILLPSSKSAAHRTILAAALSHEKCAVNNVDLNADITATLNAIKAMGIDAKYISRKKRVEFTGEYIIPQGVQTVDCIESGSTLRFVIPIFAALGISARFIGSGLLPQRPIGIYTELLQAHGVEVKTQGGLPFEISGRLQSGIYELPGNVSSQFITGLMLALPQLKGDSEIVLTTSLESGGYVDLTLEVLENFGIVIDKTENGWHISGRQRYQGNSCAVEGDWSHAAFFLSMAAICGGEILLKGLKENSSQGDRACVKLYREFGIDTDFTESGLKALNPKVSDKFRGLKAAEIDASQIPDLIPAAAVCGAFAKGTTHIYNAGRLRLKECDRLEAIADAINRLGGKAVIKGDDLFIDGVENLTGGKAFGMNDHRIPMALSAASLGSKGQVSVTDAESINKSYPLFYRDFRSLGGIADVIDLG